MTAGRERCPQATVTLRGEREREREIGLNMLVNGVTDALDHQDEVMDLVGHSIKRVAKKLHKLELMMHNEPAEDAEMRDKLHWQEKMSKLLKYDVAKRLPTLREVQLAQYKKQKGMNKKSGERIERDQSH
jgi:hypothetical protein